MNEQININLLLVRNAVITVEKGIEYAKDTLSEHDTKLGRNNPSNNLRAVNIESDILSAEIVLKQLKELL